MVKILSLVGVAGLIKDTQHLKEDVMYLRVKLDEVNGKLDLLLTR